MVHVLSGIARKGRDARVIGVYRAASDSLEPENVAQNLFNRDSSIVSDRIDFSPSRGDVRGIDRGIVTRVF